jgi:hypothetical protein
LFLGSIRAAVTKSIVDTSDEARRWLTLLRLGVAVAAFLILLSHHTITMVANIISLAIGFSFNFSMSTFYFSGVRTHLKDHGYLKLALSKTRTPRSRCVRRKRKQQHGDDQHPKTDLWKKANHSISANRIFEGRNIGAMNVPRQELISSTPSRHWREPGPS